MPCEVLYDKRGEGGGLSTLWRAQNEAGYCEAKAAEFVAKLENLGYTCTEGSEPDAEENPAPNN